MRFACHSSTIHDVPDSPEGQRWMAVAREMMDRSTKLLNGIALNRILERSGVEIRLLRAGTSL
jgi:hypothetical protein